jgi:hypothetical protein
MCSKRSRNGRRDNDDAGTEKRVEKRVGAEDGGNVAAGVEGERFGDDNEERGDGRFGYLRVLRCE